MDESVAERSDREMVIMSSDIKKSMKAQEMAKKLKSNESKVDLSKYKEYDITFAGRKTTLLHNDKDGKIIIEGMLFTPNITTNTAGLQVVEVSGHEYHIDPSAGQIFLDGRMVEFSYTPSVPTLKRSSGSASGKEVIRAPLPGVIVGIHVKVGDVIKPGSKIITLEAMKMQNELITEMGGVVKSISVKLQDQVDNNSQLIEIFKEEKPLEEE